MNSEKNLHNIPYWDIDVPLAFIEGEDVEEKEIKLSSAVARSLEVLTEDPSQENLRALIGFYVELTGQISLHNIDVNSPSTEEDKEHMHKELIRLSLAVRVYNKLINKFMEQNELAWRGIRIMIEKTGEIKLDCSLLDKGELKAMEMFVETLKKIPKEPQ